MLIEKTQIRNLDRYLSVLPPGSMFKVVSEVDDKGLARVGFEVLPVSGTSILPAAVGRVTRFNAEGRWVTRRDLPKEERYVGSRSWVHTEWDGPGQTREVEETVDVYRLCYPRDLIAPPSVEVSYVEYDGRRLMCSPELEFIPHNADANKHAINLMLELFGACEIVLEGLARITPPATRRANWVMLPPGEHPWDRIEEHILALFAGKTPTVAKVVLARQHVILAHKPSAIFKGLAGFSDYIAYIFEERHLVVLESVHYGNALYVLGDDWEDISKLTKAEIIRHGLAEGRIVHTKNWVSNLADVIEAGGARAA